MDDSIYFMPGCALCKESGLIYLPDFPPCYRFCACAAGVRRRESEPDVVDEANSREIALGVRA